MVKFKDFKLTAAIARNLANQLWQGDAHAMKTNTKGAFYFSCAGHGGYIVDAAILTDEQKAQIEAEGSQEEHLQVCVQYQVVDAIANLVHYEPVVLGVASPFSLRGHSVRYNPAAGIVEWRGYPFYVFEEDCDWAILETYTPIRCLEEYNPELNDGKTHDELAAFMLTRMREWKEERRLKAAAAG